VGRSIYTPLVELGDNLSTGGARSASTPGPEISNEFEFKWNGNVGWNDLSAVQNYDSVARHISTDLYQIEG
jgi:hypothetical protein